MDPTRQFTDRLGVTVDSKSSYLLVAVLLVAGTYAIAVPIISFIRVLFSLFILPGKSVSFLALHQALETNIHSYLPMDLAAHGL